MIADATQRVAIPSSSNSPQPSNPAWHERFLALMPAIVRHARLRLRHLPAARREEAIHEVVALALVAYARLVELGTEDIAYATPLADYSVRQYWADRRVGLQLNSKDLLSDRCRRKHGHRIERLDRFDDATGAWQEALVEDHRFGPADAAATRIDFNAWLATLPQHTRQLAEKLATGESTSTVARLFGVSAGRVSQLRRELADSWATFQQQCAPALA